jgi:uncharacterized protein YdhG (YjbR/CyaY superfamily)
MQMTTKFKTISEYIIAQNRDVQPILELIRETVQKAAPQATEVISYGMPAFKLKKVVVYFAAYKNHIGFYALPSGNAAFQEQLLKYKTGKGSIQFPLSEPMPLGLIKKIVDFRVKELAEDNF